MVISAVQQRDSPLSLSTHTHTHTNTCSLTSFFFQHFILFANLLKVLLFILGFAGSLLLGGLLSGCSELGATVFLMHTASQCGGFSCGANTLEELQLVGAAVLWLPGPRAQAQYLWFTVSVALWQVGSSWTGDRTRVCCIGRQIIHH